MLQTNRTTQRSRLKWWTDSRVFLRLIAAHVRLQEVCWFESLTIRKNCSLLMLQQPYRYLINTTYVLPTYIRTYIHTWFLPQNHVTYIKSCTNLKKQINLTMFNKVKRSSVDILSINLKAFGLRGQIVRKDRKIKHGFYLIQTTT